MKQLCSFALREANKMNPENKRLDYLFLNYIARAIRDPAKFGLIGDSLKKSQVKALLLVSLLINQLATDQILGNDEPYLKNANGFLFKNSPAIKKLAAALSEPSSTNEEGMISKIYLSQAEVLDSIQYVSAALDKNKSKVIEELVLRDNKKPLPFKSSETIDSILVSLANSGTLPGK
eukprot:TRINITY_DN10369_c0_g1_i1.p1 TRINITY_DN10369_c0_g1~~TRINITY_DN10369_c0_g1_i1.p1  ORF type:complete len:177 (-),score=25.99 TRINITY_DN10369_c0_g1_i1:12-542(-)